MTTTTQVPVPTTRPVSRVAQVGAVVVAATAAALGLAAWRDPGGSPLTRTDGPLLASLVPPTAVAVLVTVAGIAGLVAVLAGLPATGRPRAVLATLFAAEVAVLGFALGSVSSIALAGYLLAAAMPVLLAVLAVQAVRRYRRLRWVALALVAGVAAWGAVTGTLRPDSLATLGAGLITGFETAAPRLVVAVLSAAATATFGLLVLAEVRETDMWTRTGTSVALHRTAWTLVAACCALPYGLVRMTWLTPWPVLGQSEMLTSDIRLWGLLLGSAALLGFVLTMGLVRPWGERFPRWVPRLAGRPVPVPVAAVPGGLVAAVVCTSALPMLQGLTFTTAGTGLGVDGTAVRIAMAFVFPFWLWGPTLALAVWGYVVHRQAADTLAGSTAG